MSSSAPQPGAPIEAVSHGPITLDILKLYAQASGDYNPIHTDEAAAKNAGLPGVIAHGMLTAGFMADRAVRYMKPWEKNWKLTGFQTRFRAMLFLGDTVQVSGSVKSVDENTVCLELKAVNGKGEITTQGYAEYIKAP